MTQPGLPYFHDSELTTRIESNVGGPARPASAAAATIASSISCGRFLGVVEAGGVVEGLADADDDGRARIDRHGRTIGGRRRGP